MATKKVTGKVHQIYVENSLTFIRLKDLKKEETPRFGNFVLSKSHENYNAFYSLALGAAINRYNLTIETKQEINSTQNAEVHFMIVTW